ncbi:MAG: hypothetical protein ACI4TT_01740, partial [Christensenellales bacterium]
WIISEIKYKDIKNLKNIKENKNAFDNLTKYLKVQKHFFNYDYNNFCTTTNWEDLLYDTLLARKNV